MKCEKCGSEMKKLRLVPKFGRKSFGKQFYKIKCQGCGEIKYVKPRDYL